MTDLQHESSASPNGSDAKIPWIRERTILISLFIPILLGFYAYVPTLLGMTLGNPWLSYFPPFSMFAKDSEHQHLGAEYWNITQSIMQGDGFSSPFGEPSGPTAWMPPLLPLILASLYWLSGANTALTAEIYVTINTCVFVWVVCDVARWTATGGRRDVCLIPMSIACVLIANFRDNFQITHDGTLQLALFHWLCRQAIGFEVWRFWKWGILGGLVSLASPSITATWILMSIYLFAKNMTLKNLESESIDEQPAIVDQRLRGYRKPWIGFMVAGFMGLAIQSPWLVRNYLFFDRIIPIKSNGLFELEQSLLRDEDGVLDFTENLNHPYIDRQEASKHAAVGELAYVEERMARLRGAFLENRWKYGSDCLNRFAAILFVHMPMTDHAEIFTWTQVTRVLYFLPWCVFLSSLCLKERLTSQQKTIFLAFTIYVLPYLLLSYYSRYMIPMMGVRSLVMIWGLQRWLRSVNVAPNPQTV